MKRYKITLLVPVEKEILAVDLKSAGKEGERLVKLHNNKSDALKTVLRSVKFVQDEPEPIDFGFTDGEAA